ncbi:hypothetical protein EP47_09370, partial [Legionella norrlandica]
MKTIINPQRFANAVEYTSANYFSQPYSISPIIDRWFNQLAIVELENGNLIHISGKDAFKYVNITVDGKIISNEDVQLAHRFHSQHSEHEKERVKIESSIEQLEKEITDNRENIVLEPIHRELEQKKQELEKHKKDKEKALEVYTAIVDRGVSSINIKQIEAESKSKVKNIVYRPNHGLAHSVRAAYSITTLHQYDLEHDSKTLALSEQDLEKLQLMMLFSVVGRKDETGWADTGNLQQGCDTYRNFRKKSGTEYLNYCLNHQLELYQNNKEEAYRDAITVELMGYTGIEDTLSRREPSTIETFVEYVIYKEKEQHKGSECSREEAIKLIKTGKYQLQTLFPNGPVRHLANAKAQMMNKAHGLELVRCYSLYPSKEGGSSCIGILHSKLYGTGFFSTLANPGFPTPHAIKHFDSFFKLMRNSFDLMALTGQKTTFGIPTLKEYEEKKQAILLKVKTIYEAAKDSSKLAELRQKAIDQNPNLEFYLDKTNLSRLTQQLIVVSIAEAFSQSPRLQYDKAMFEFQNLKSGDISHIDNRLNAIKVIQAMQAVTPYPGIEVNSPKPIISAVKHDRSRGIVKVIFDTQPQAQNFTETYAIMFHESPNIRLTDKGQYEIEVNRKDYKHLHHERLIEFKTVEVPQKTSREEALVSSDGEIEPLGMIKHSRALVRLVSTTALKNETFPDYNYLFNALNDPIHQRYSPKPRETAEAPIDVTKYRDPRNGQIIPRTVAKEPLPLRYQEPITEPVPFEDRIFDGWTVSRKKEKNTIYTKKMAYSLLPPHGKMIPFSGYSYTRTNYFPIGVISDVGQVDLHDQRYIWSQNMATVQRMWIRDLSVFTDKIYTLLKVQRDENNNPVRNPTGIITIDRSKLNLDKSSGALLRYIEEHLKEFTTKLDNKFAQPPDDFLKDCQMLVQQEWQIYKEHFHDNPNALHKINKMYQQALNRIELEATRKSSKYAITLRELIELQKKEKAAIAHNEILASNTKGAIRALYAPRDELFYRLNLALHTKYIKENHGYDVPLVIVSLDREPYYYSEDLIRRDLKEAYTRLRTGDFPYDKEEFTLYEVDKDGNPKLDVNGKPIKKLGMRGEELKEPKNQVYQQQVLLDLFKLGNPNLTSLDQLTKGQINSNKSLDDTIDRDIDSILDKIALLGGLSRERKYLESVLASSDTVTKEKAF